jgi:hypothetical protein
MIDEKENNNDKLEEAEPASEENSEQKRSIIPQKKQSVKPEDIFDK